MDDIPHCFDVVYSFQRSSMKFLERSSENFVAKFLRGLNRTGICSTDSVFARGWLVMKRSIPVRAGGREYAVLRIADAFFARPTKEGDLRWRDSLLWRAD
jgi:hypothetical protein